MDTNYRFIGWLCLIGVCALFPERAIRAEETEASALDYQRSLIEDARLNNGRYHGKRAAASVAHEAGAGLSAPQIAMDPEFPRTPATWREFAEQWPDAAAELQPCVDQYFAAIEIVKSSMAPLMVRPTYDVSADQLNALGAQASALVDAGDACIAAVPDGTPSPEGNADRSSVVLTGRVVEEREAPNAVEPEEDNTPAPGGDIEVIFNPGPIFAPDDRGTPAQPNDPCQSFLPPAWCQTEKSNRPSRNGVPDRKPSPWPVQLVAGLSQGIEDCWTGLGHQVGDALLGAYYFAQLDFIEAEQAWNLERGQGLMARKYYQDLTRQAVGANSLDAGRRIAERLCANIAVPAAIKASRIGGTPFNPIQQRHLATRWQNAQGAWVDLGRSGVVQLGGRLNKSSQGATYLNLTNPSELIRVMNPNGAAAAVSGQVTGFFHTLQQQNIATPTITDFEPGSATQPAYIKMTNYSTIYTDVRTVPTLRRMSPEMQTAVRHLHDKVGNAGYIWADSHPGNIFFHKRNGRLEAGISAPTELVPAQSFREQSQLFQRRTKLILGGSQGSGRDHSNLVDQPNIDARAVMRRIYGGRYRR